MKKRRMGYQMYNIYLTCKELFDVDEEFELTFDIYLDMMTKLEDIQEIDLRGFKVAIASLLEYEFLIKTGENIYKIGNVSYKKRKVYY